MNDPEQSRVDRLDANLYSRTRYRNPLEKRSVMSAGETPSVESDWHGEKLDDLLAHERRVDEAHPFLKKFFIFAVLFFIAAVAIAALVFFGGVNFVSSKNVDITVVGPAEVSAGEIVNLGVTIENKNNTDLELVNFSVQFPQGSRDPKDSSKSLTYSREDIGVIGAGDEEARNVSIVLLGSKGEQKEIKFSVEYKVKGSNATFYKDKLYTVTIGNTPLSIKITNPNMVSAGEIFTTEIAVTLNSQEPLKNAILRAEYPYGFAVTESTPSASAADNVWTLGDLAPGVTKKVKIKGRMSGENQDERTFRFYVGVGEGGDNPNFKTVILSDQDTILIERPAIALSILLNGESAPNYTAPAGKTVRVSARFKNNLPDKVLNPRLEVKLNGAALDKASVVAESGGSYSPSTGRISWSIFNLDQKSELNPGEDGEVAFSFASQPSTALFSSAQEIGLVFTFTGTPVGNLEALSVDETRLLKIAAQVSLNSASVYSTGPFVNSGPKPPKVGETTTYTVTLSAGNTQGTVTDAKVTGRLGSNVKWLSAKSFSSEDITYDEKANTVTWKIGTLAPGAGFSAPAREVSFQVALTPAAVQAGKAATLFTGILFNGTDAETARAITLTNPALTTTLPSDPSYAPGDDVVVK